MKCCNFLEGVVEIWLTSEDLGAYGHDIGVTLPQLLWKLVEVIPEGARMRLGMTNPPYILEHLQVSIYYCLSIFRTNIMGKKVCVTTLQ